MRQQMVYGLRGKQQRLRLLLAPRPRFFRLPPLLGSPLSLFSSPQVTFTIEKLQIIEDDWVKSIILPPLFFFPSFFIMASRPGNKRKADTNSMASIR